jgi:hypothetical protein
MINGSSGNLPAPLAALLRMIGDTIAELIASGEIHP